MTEHRISRRRFVGATAAVGAGALAGGTGTAAGAPARRKRSRKVDVVIVGGGFAGLAAAYEVMKAGRSVLVLEAQDGLRIERDQLSQDLRQGNLCKVAAVYDRPFWRDAGLNGTVVSLNGPVNVVYDDSPPDASPGVLFGFVGGDEARDFYAKPPADRRSAVLGNFESYFGPQARNATEYHETLWPAQRWHRGGPVGVAGPGTLVAHGHALREPVGDIHWAGTESSTFWVGYMDGAVRSGQRAAAEVLGAL